MAVLITGASRGLGRALVKEYRENGSLVIGLSRGLGLSFKKEGQGYYKVAFDWKQYDGLGKMLGDLLEGEGERIDVLVNNAGLLNKSDLMTSDKASFLEQMEVNVWNALEVFRTLYSGSLFSRQAQVINIGSMGGVQGTLKFPGLFSYSASKAALISLTEAMDAEFGSEGLSFNCLALGAVNTEMLKAAFPGYISQVEPENMAKFIRMFSEGSGQLMSGKVIQVAKSNPKA